MLVIAKVVDMDTPMKATWSTATPIDWAAAVTMASLLPSESAADDNPCIVRDEENEITGAVPYDGAGVGLSVGSDEGCADGSRVG